MDDSDETDTNTPKNQDKDDKHDEKHDQEDEQQHDQQHDVDEQLDQGVRHDDPMMIASESSTGPPDTLPHNSTASTNPSANTNNNDSEDGRNSGELDTLRVYRGPADPEEDSPSIQILQEPGSLEHMAMCECVNAAMLILDQARNRGAMAIYSVGAVKAMKAKYGQSTAGPNLSFLDGNEIRAHISRWLDHMGRRFPNLYISSSIEDDYGETARYRWGNDVDSYDPVSAARISVHSGVFDRACALKDRMAEYARAYSGEWQLTLQRLEDDVLWVQQNQGPKAIAEAEAFLQEYRRNLGKMEKLTRNYKIHYERSLFQLAATLAHECFHVLTGFWTGSKDQDTPPEFFGEVEDENEGEAGDWWEHNHGFNGSVVLAWHKSDKSEDDPCPLDDDNMSAGLPFLWRIRYGEYGSRAGSEWIRISHPYIKDVIKKGKSGSKNGLNFNH